MAEQALAAQDLIKLTARLSLQSIKLTTSYISIQASTSPCGQINTMVHRSLVYVDDAVPLCPSPFFANWASTQIVSRLSL
jgi:hypothetical protein